jgi:lysine-N-methylase
MGSSCPETCCSGWTVNVDKSTYKKMMQLDDKVLPKDEKKKFIKLEAASTSSYARIAMDERNNCSFLNADKLCSLQLQLGHDHLCSTCRDYPRQYTKYKEETALFGMTSCPKMAELCVKDEAPWALESIVLPIPVNKPIHHIAGGSGTRGATPRYFQQYKMIRDAVIDMLQDRTLPLWQRLLLVSIVCKELDAEPDEPDTEKLNARVEFILLNAKLTVLNGSFKESIDPLIHQEVPLLAQQVFIKRLNDERLMLGLRGNEIVINKAFFDSTSEALMGIGYDSNDLETTASNFAKAKAGFEAFELTHPHVLEKYLCNTVALQTFPIAKVGQSLFEQWRAVLIKYAMVRFYLIGSSQHHGEQFNLDHVTKIIYSYSKAIAHNSVFNDMVDRFLKDNQLNSLAAMLILIR